MAIGINCKKRKNQSRLRVQVIPCLAFIGIYVFLELNQDMNVQGRDRALRRLGDPSIVTGDDVLTPTFSTFRNFQAEGPRKRFEGGKSQHELLVTVNKTTEHALDRVPFFRHNGVYYSAAWLSSMKTFLKNEKVHLEKLPDKFSPNLEAGTFLGIEKKANYRSVDMLDFFVHHLSQYKRMFTGFIQGIASNDELWQQHLQRLVEMERTYERIPFNNPKQSKNGKVLVFIPFHAPSDHHSKQDEKQLFLNITVKSLARVFPNIVISVCDEAHYDFIMNNSGLNQYLYDILLVKSITNGPVENCEHLPTLSSVWAREKIREGNWVGFEWVYYTEADEPLHLRNVNEVLKKALHDERTVVVPHRSFPAALPGDMNVTSSVLEIAWDFFMDMTGKKVVHDVPDLHAKGCCFEKILDEYDYNFYSPRVELFQQYNGHAQTTGVCNEFKLLCQSCKFIDRTKETCKEII
jgi:hypothetical protein